MMQSRGSFFMPKQNLYFWIKIEWWWFYYFYFNNHYCHNSEPLSPCTVPGTLRVLHALHYLMVWNKSISQKLSSQIQHWGVCGTAWAPLTHPVHSTSSASWAKGRWSLSSHADMRAPGWPQLDIQDHNTKTWCWGSTKATDAVVAVINWLWCLLDTSDWINSWMVHHGTISRISP